HTPALANFFTQTPGLNALAKLAAGYSQHRHIPPFAPETFKEWLRRRDSSNGNGKPEVILWADTFNGHFTPNVAKAAVEVLEHAGFRVCVPQASLCCGRPLYDYGMLDTAKTLFRDTLTALREPIRAGIPVIGLEPSGMAGSFGYEADHYDVGLACGERGLLPAVRKGENHELILSNGFRCREMIPQETDRHALPLAQSGQKDIYAGRNRPM